MVLGHCAATFLCVLAHENKKWQHNVQEDVGFLKTGYPKP